MDVLKSINLNTSTTCRSQHSNITSCKKISTNATETIKLENEIITIDSSDDESSDEEIVFYSTKNIKKEPEEIQHSNNSISENSINNINSNKEIKTIKLESSSEIIEIDDQQLDNSIPNQEFTTINQNNLTENANKSINRDIDNLSKDSDSSDKNIKKEPQEIQHLNSSICENLINNIDSSNDIKTVELESSSEVIEIDDQQLDNSIPNKEFTTINQNKLTENVNTCINHDIDNFSEDSDSSNTSHKKISKKVNRKHSRIYNVDSESEDDNGTSDSENDEQNLVNDDENSRGQIFEIIKLSLKEINFDDRNETKINERKKTLVTSIENFISSKKPSKEKDLTSHQAEALKELEILKEQIENCYDKNEILAAFTKKTRQSSEEAREKIKQNLEYEKNVDFETDDFVEESTSHFCKQRLSSTSTSISSLSNTPLFQPKIVIEKLTDDFILNINCTDKSSENFETDEPSNESTSSKTIRKFNDCLSKLWETTLIQSNKSILPKLRIKRIYKDNNSGCIRSKNKKNRKGNKKNKVNTEVEGIAKHKVNTENDLNISHNLIEKSIDKSDVQIITYYQKPFEHESFKKLLSSTIKHFKANPPIAKIQTNDNYNVLCIFCQRTFLGTKNDVFEHYSTHTGEYCYKCFKCGTQSSLRAEIRLHCKNSCGEYSKIYEDICENQIKAKFCVECNFMQLNQQNLIQHIKQYHSITKEPERLCEEIILAKFNPRIEVSTQEINKNLKLIFGDDSFELTTPTNSQENSLNEIQISSPVNSNKKHISDVGCDDINNNSLGKNEEDKHKENDEKKKSKIYDKRKSCKHEEKYKKLKHRPKSSYKSKTHESSVPDITSEDCILNKNLLVLPKFVAPHYRYRCPSQFCNLKFPDEKNLESHFQGVHRSITKYKCSNCDFHIDKEIRDFEQIKSHIRMHSEFLYVCTCCSFYHHQRSIVQQHVRLNHKLQNSITKIMRSSIDIRYETCIEENKNILRWNSCLICKETIINPEGTADHVQIHHSIPVKYKCQYCEFHGKDADITLTHIKNAHNKTVGILCLFSFRNVLYDKDDIKREKNYKGSCNENFNRKRRQSLYINPNATKSKKSKIQLQTLGCRTIMARRATSYLPSPILPRKIH